ncbi:WavE lipopolysaccharide synthesis family protein [Pseudomonas aeruginosa]
MRPVCSSEVSVVIQGPLYRSLAPERGIEACIESIRNVLPQAEVIVSTWEAEDVAGLKADLIIQSADPGTMRDITGNTINTNRMVASTKAGIEASTRPYVMKFRSDHLMTNPSLASISDYQGPERRPRLFQAPLTVTNLFIRDPRRCPMLYHMSDLVQFGLREDMLTFWDQPVYTGAELFNDKPTRNPFGNFVGYSKMKMTSEQALMITVMRNQGMQVDYLPHPCHVTSAGLKLWEEVLEDNFRVIGWQTSGVDFPGRFANSGYWTGTVYSQEGISAAAALSGLPWIRRRAMVWANQFLFHCAKPIWWRATASIALFTLSPALAVKVRRLWRRACKIEHPSPEKR